MRRRILQRNTNGARKNRVIASKRFTSPGQKVLSLLTKSKKKTKGTNQLKTPLPVPDVSNAFHPYYTSHWLTKYNILI